MRPPCYCDQQTPFGILISSSRFNPAGMASEETVTVIDLPYGVTFITLTTRLDWKSLKCSCPSAAFIWPNVGRINGVTLYNNGLLSCRPLHLDRLKHQHLHHPLEHLHRHSSKCQLQKTRLRLTRKSIIGQWWFLEVSVTPSDRTVSRNLFVCTSIFCLPLFFLSSSYTEYYDCLKFCHIYSQSLSDYLFARLFDLKGIKYKALTLTVKLK